MAAAGDAEPRGSSTNILPSPPAPKPWRKRVDMTVAIIGASLVALLSGTPNGFNFVSHRLEADTGTSDPFISLLTGVGIAGLQFSLPAGIIADNYGTTVACLVSGLSVVAGYMAMSFVTSPVLLLICYALVGIGSGGTYLSALQTSVTLGYSVGIGAVSLCMSLSLNVVITVSNTYANDTGCFENSCWREYVRVYGATCAAAMGIGAIGLYVAGKYHGAQSSGASNRPRKISLDLDMPLHRTLRIFRKPFFLACFYSNLMGVGSGVFVVSTARQLWRSFDKNPLAADWFQTLLVLFSILTGASNVLSPILSGWLHRTGRLRRAHYTAVVLGMMTLLFVALGLFASVDALQSSQGSAVNITYLVMLAGVGIGFGTSLSTYPAVLADNFGFRNFGAYMSFLQFGAGCCAIVGPVAAAWVFTATGRYAAMHWIFCGCLLLATVAMTCVPSTTQTFACDVDEGYGRFGDGQIAGAAARASGRAGSEGDPDHDEISLPPSTPVQHRRPPQSFEGGSLLADSRDAAPRASYGTPDPRADV